MRRKTLIWSTMMLLAFSIKAQQLAQYSQYNFNQYLLNPAVGGLSKHLEAQAGFRSQWAGFEGAPTTMFVSIHAPLDYPISNSHIKEKPHKGVGGYIFRDEAGPSTWTGAYMSYAYHMALNPKFHLSLGAFVGAKHYVLDGSKIQFTHSETDPKVTGQRETAIVPDGNIGIWVHSDKVFGGISVNQIFQNKLDIEQVKPGQEFGKLDNHYFLTAGYIYKVNSQLKIIPSFLLKAVAPAPLQVDLSVKAFIDDTFWVGASLRNLDAFVIFGGVRYGNFEAGYAFDLTFNGIQKFSAGSHEIIVGLLLPRFEKDINCPSRFW